MPLYAYRCAAATGAVCPEFEVSLPMGSAPGSVPCPACGNPSPRRFTAPNLSRASSSAYRLIEGTQRSAAEPDVVRSPVSGPRTGRSGTSNPLHRKLPRPD